MKRAQLHIIILLNIAVFLSSCATMSKTDILKLFNDKADQVGSDTDEDHYLLGPDDIINIIVEQHHEWSGNYTIGPQGNITIPSLGEINAEGLSKNELKILFSTYLEEYINNPRVTVEIITYASQVVYILGEVKKPGKYPTEGKNYTLLDAVLTAGLPNKFAATKRVFVISSSRKKPTQQVINLYRILYKGELKNNINLQPGDIVFVPTTILGKISHFLSSLLSPVSSIAAAQSMTAP